MNTVEILLSTYNGEKYLQEQLDSLLEQTNVFVKILVRDDGSTDSTKKILESYQQKGLLKWYTGENLRSAKSFMDLVEKSSDEKYFAFCDQDDYWLPDKLEIAVKWLELQDDAIPSLYYGCPIPVDAHLQPLPIVYNKERMVTFESMLINSNCTGCTMVFNKALMDIVKEKRPNYISMHDAWFHKVCIACKGNVFYDENVHILYRQHENNVIGMQQSKWSKLKRRIKSLTNKECMRSRMIVSLVECYGQQMDPEQLGMAQEIALYRNSILARIKLLFNKKIKTGYSDRDHLYKIAVFLGVF